MEDTPCPEALKDNHVLQKQCLIPRKDVKVSKIHSLLIGPELGFVDDACRCICLCVLETTRISMLV